MAGLLASSTAYSATLAADGVATAYPFTFPLRSADDLTVTVNGVAQTVTTDYTVTTTTNSDGQITGGSVDPVTPANWSTGDVVITRDTAITFDFELSNATRYDPIVLENYLNQVGMISQEYDGFSTTSVKVPDGETISRLPVAATRANKYLGFDGAGDVAMLDPNEITGADLASGAALQNIGAGGITVTYLADGAVSTAKLADDAVTAAKIADGDYGDITFASGVATLDDGSVTPAKLADGDYGFFTVTSGVAVPESGAITPAMLADADFGAFTVASGVATLDSGGAGAFEYATAALTSTISYNTSETTLVSVTITRDGSSPTQIIATMEWDSATAGATFGVRLKRGSTSIAIWDMSSADNPHAMTYQIVDAGGTSSGSTTYNFTIAGSTGSSGSIRVRDVHISARE